MSRGRSPRFRGSGGRPRGMAGRDVRKGLGRLRKAVTGMTRCGRAGTDLAQPTSGGQNYEFQDSSPRNCRCHGSFRRGPGGRSRDRGRADRLRRRSATPFSASATGDPRHRHLPTRLAATCSWMSGSTATTASAITGTSPASSPARSPRPPTPAIRWLRPRASSPATSMPRTAGSRGK